MSKLTGREIHLKSRPVGMPSLDNFELVSVPVPEPGQGEVLVRNIFMSVDPYMRGRMRGGKSYVASFELGQVMNGGCVGKVIESNSDGLQAGDYVESGYGWREYSVSAGKWLRKIDPAVAPIQAFLGTVGMPGRTAYVGLFDIGRLKEGETVYVSAAAGAVGSVACQIAKIKGCRVIGSAGSDQKVSWLTDVIGIDAAFNYKSVPSMKAKLRKLAPDGLDLYFENVGGAHLEAALDSMNNFGRIACCGMISQYNATEPPSAPNNLSFIVGKRLTLKGFIVSDHGDRTPQFYDDMRSWISQGKMKWEETIVDGLENAPQALIGLFTGENLGKMLVKVGPDPTL